MTFGNGFGRILITIQSASREAFRSNSPGGGATMIDRPAICGEVARLACGVVLSLFVAAPAAAQSTIRFATFGDYYGATTNTGRVADMVSGWNPDLILTNGDNSNVGSTAGFDTQVGQYYHNFILYPPGHPSFYAGQGAASNNFFPALGNHDWDAGLASFQAYFTLPGNERYYDFVRGPVHFFVVDADAREPDGDTSASAQAQWLQAALAAATEPWKVVCCHLPPYSSSNLHGSTPELQLAAERRHRRP
jgi:tartrate-resistant acid phosphatase type 5